MKEEMLDLCIWFSEKKILIIGDIHMGFEESLNNQGVLITRTQYKKTINRFEKIFKKVNPEIIIINGDLKQEFGKISSQEWTDVLNLLSYLKKHSKKIILIKGNHDNILGPLAFKQGLKLIEKYEFDDICVTHGHKIVKTNKHKIIIGHEHPCVTLSDNVSSEKTKCFLIGYYGRKHLIVMPSFNLITQGRDITQTNQLSPYLKQKLSNFDIYIPVDDEVLYFGQLSNL